MKINLDGVSQKHLFRPESRSSNFLINWLSRESRWAFWKHVGCSKNKKIGGLDGFSIFGMFKPITREDFLRNFVWEMIFDEQNYTVQAIIILRPSCPHQKNLRSPFKGDFLYGESQKSRHTAKTTYNGWKKASDSFSWQKTEFTYALANCYL